MPRKLLETKHDLGTKFSVVLILKKFLKSIHGQRKDKMEARERHETVDCYRILILFVPTTKLNALNS